MADPEKVQDILGRMREGASMREACKAVGVPNPTFMLWVDSDPELAEQYARARDSMYDAIADDLTNIADTEPAVMDAAHVAHAKLRIDTRKWLLSKRAPKKYGDRLELAGDPLAPVVHQITRRVVDAKAPDDDDQP